MDLIEQLGGYEQAKGLFNLYEYSISFKYCLDSSGDFESWVYLDVFVLNLKQTLLKHRRENNIFEVGDWVVSTLEGGEDWKNVVCEILGFHKKMAITTGFSCAIHHYEYRHATDAEIEVGHRMELN